MSKKRATQILTYLTERKAFLKANPVCQVWLKENRRQSSATNGDLIACRAPIATEIHHIAKRRGAALNDTSKWLAVCRENHERIEQNKVWARANGYLDNF